MARNEPPIGEALSGYLLGSDDPTTLRRFAEEVAPAVRELVDAHRTGAPATARTTALPQATASAPLAVLPTPDDGTRTTAELAWDESTRPTGPNPNPARTYTAHEQAAGQHLVDTHDSLRAELAQLRDVVEQVAQGVLQGGEARSLINTMALRQNNWTLGAFCESYCRIVTGHHSLEDRSVFPHLRRSDPRMAPVLDRVDRALVALVSAPDGMAQVQQAVDLLTDTLLSHLSYEERELIEPLARFGYY